MKNQLFTLAAVLTASAALTGCSSEQLVDNTLAQETATVGKSHVVIINATKPGNDDFTRAVEKDGGALKTKWVADEVVYAYKGNAGSSVSYTIKSEDISGEGDKKATLKFDFGETTFAENDEIVLYYQKEKDGYDNYSGQDGTLTKISTDYDRMKATVTVLAVNPSGEILATSNADFKRQQAITKFTIQKKGTTPTSLAISPLNINESALGDLVVTPTYATDEIWVALPGRASTAAAAEKTYKFETIADSKQYGFSKSVDLVNNKYYTATLTMGRDIQKITVTGLPAGSPATQGYTGAAVNVTGTTSSESDEMISSTDYTVTYQKNTGTPESPVWVDCSAEDVKNAGQYKAVIKGNGDYEGTEEKIFSITKISETEVNTALTAGTIADNIEISQGTNTPIVPSTAFGLTGEQIKAGAEVDINDSNVKSSITIGTKTPNTEWASINNDGELVTTGGGIVTVTISLPETANHAAGSVTKTIYVKQSGIGGELPDPGNDTW